MRLVPITLDLWKAAQRWEAAEWGYTVSFFTQGDRVVAPRLVLGAHHQEIACRGAEHRVSPFECGSFSLHCRRSRKDYRASQGHKSDTRVVGQPGQDKPNSYSTLAIFSANRAAKSCKGSSF